SDAILAQIRNGLGETFTIETQCLRSVIFGTDIQRYGPVNPSKYLIYPYRNGAAMTEAELAEHLPLTFRYLSAYRALLEGRSSAIASGKTWFELVRERDEQWLSKKKLVMRDLATEPSFAADLTGEVFLVGGSAVVPADPSHLLPL